MLSLVLVEMYMFILCLLEFPSFTLENSIDKNDKLCINAHTHARTHKCSVYQIDTQVQTGIFIKYYYNWHWLTAINMLTSQLASTVMLSSASAAPSL